MQKRFLIRFQSLTHKDQTLTGRSDTSVVLNKLWLLLDQLNGLGLLDQLNRLSRWLLHINDSLWDWSRGWNNNSGSSSWATFDLGIESVFSVSGVGDSADGTIGLNNRVATTNFVPITGLSGALAVTSLGVVDIAL